MVGTLENGEEKRKSKRPGKDSLRGLPSEATCLGRRGRWDVAIFTRPDFTLVVVAKVVVSKGGIQVWRIRVTGPPGRQP
jgi:hypothetical protein